MPKAAAIVPVLGEGPQRPARIACACSTRWRAVTITTADSEREQRRQREAPVGPTRTDSVA